MFICSVLLKRSYTNKKFLFIGVCYVPNQVEFHGMDGFGGPLYIGTGCFHRRDTLCGRVFSTQSKSTFWSKGNDHQYFEETAYDLEERLKDVARCTFEKDTEWGNEVPYLDLRVCVNVCCDPFIHAMCRCSVDTLWN